MATDTSADLLSVLVDDLAAAIEAVGGSTVAVAAGSGVSGESWTFALTLTGALQGSARVSLDASGVTTLLQLVLGPEADTSEAAARDLLSELMNQALGSLKVHPVCADVSVALEGVERSASRADQSRHFALVFGTTTLQMAAGVKLESLEAAAGKTTGHTARPAAPQPAAAAGTVRATPHGAPHNLDVVLDIELPLSVRFGATMMTVRALSGLGPGSIVDMGRTPDDPVEILVCGRPIARAEVVIVGGNYGVRITDLTSAVERLRAMEGQL